MGYRFKFLLASLLLLLPFVYVGSWAGLLYGFSLEMIANNHLLGGRSARILYYILVVILAAPAIAAFVFVITKDPAFKDAQESINASKNQTAFLAFGCLLLSAMLFGVIATPVDKYGLNPIRWVDTWMMVLAVGFLPTILAIINLSEDLLLKLTTKKN